MTDIVERLRKAIVLTPLEIDEAAEEIERLRELTLNVPGLLDEIERLRGEVDKLLMWNGEAGGASMH